MARGLHDLALHALRGAPVHSPGVVWTPNLEHSIMVPVDSPVKTVADLEGKTVGLVTGSSAEFAFAAYARGNGGDPKSVTLRTLPIPDQATMPRGIDAVLPWPPTPLLMARHDPKGAAAVLRTDPALNAYPDELLYEETVRNMVNDKPSWIYPFVDLYADEGARVAKFLHDGGRLRQPLDEKDYRAWFRGGSTSFDNTYGKLGWKIPKKPPYFASGMTAARYREAGEKGEKFDMILPYRMDQPQPFPEPTTRRPAGS